MSSSESEDENIKKFTEAVDVKLFNNNFYKEDNEKEKKDDKVQTVKSQRHLDEEENVFHSELNVPESMKIHIAKKMSAIIEKDIEFIDVPVINREYDELECVKLLSGFKESLKTRDPAEDEIVQNRVKIPIKRRQMEVSEEKESSKIKKSATDLQKIHQEVATWTNKTRHSAFEFKTASDGKSYLKEATTEYTKARKRNNWNESLIKNSRNYGKSLNKILSKP